MLLELELTPLDGPFGRRVENIDLARAASPGLARKLDEAMVEHQVLLFRGQTLDDPALREVASWFGAVRDLPGGHKPTETTPGVRHLSNADANGAPSGRHPVPISRYWHTDGGDTNPRARATLLFAKTVPPNDTGGTQFADMYSALDAFDADELKRLEALQVVHDIHISRVVRHGDRLIPERRLPVWRRLVRWRRFLQRFQPDGQMAYPAIRRCPDNDRPAIILGASAWRVKGVGWREGMALVDELNERTIRPEHILTHHWVPGDLIVWDNRSLLHRVLEYDVTASVRDMRKVVTLERSSG